MAKGIDVGTGNLVGSKMVNGQIVYTPHRDAFLKLDASNDFVKKALANTTASYIVKDDSIYVLGDDANKFANLLGKEVSRPLKAGVISSEEKEASEILELLLQAVAGEPEKENEILYYSIPANSVDVENDTIYHDFLIGNVYRSLGYDARSINEAMAVGYSNLGNDNLTGLALSFGAGMVNLSLMLMGVSVVEFSVARSGDWIDASSAKMCGSTATKMQAIKESGIDLSLPKQDTKEKQIIMAYYLELIKYVIKHFKQEFSKTGAGEQFNMPIPVVLAGGTSLPKGFDKLFEDTLRKSNFPLQISEVRRANDPLNDISKGCLLAALADEN